MTKQTVKYLQLLKKKEKKMKWKLAKVDSTKATQTFGDVDAKYDEMIAVINSDSLPIKQGGAYILVDL